MIGECEVCGRQNVPVAKVNDFACEIVACFICQGDIADPYGEIELYERASKSETSHGE